MASFAYLTYVVVIVVVVVVVVVVLSSTHNTMQLHAGGKDSHPFRSTDSSNRKNLGRCGLPTRILPFPCHLLSPSHRSDIGSSETEIHFKNVVNFQSNVFLGENASGTTSCTRSFST